MPPERIQVNLEKCTGCRICELICSMTRHGESNPKRSRIHVFKLERFFVDVPDLPGHRVFFKEFKQMLKQRFKQVDVWITSHPVDVI